MEGHSRERLNCPPTPENAADSALQRQGVVGRNGIDTQLSALLAVIQLHYQPIGGQLVPKLALLS